MCGAISLQVDTTVCDTLLPMMWRGREWQIAGTVTDTLRDKNGNDSVRTTYNLMTTQCCPTVQSVQLDTIVCDTLLPFSWSFGDTVLIYSEPNIQKIRIPHSKWQNCTGTVYSLRLDTILCERLYPIIVNKYNWVILCDNTRVAELFPDRQPMSYTWFKDGNVIAGATTDDYSEKAELNGIFQLHLTLDNQKVIKSNILYINASGEVSQRVACYNHLGCPIDLHIPEAELPAGIYINVYQSGDNIRTEKVLIP